MKKSLISLLLFAVFAPAALASGPQVMPKDYNEVFPPSDVRYGTDRKTKTECDALPNSVWVTASWTESGLFRDTTETTSECIRYFPSSQAIGAETAALWFDGDMEQKGGVYPEGTNPGYPNNTYALQVAYADSLSRSAGIPVITVGRLGLYGSTGNTTKHRHSKREIAVMWAAVDAIKSKFGYERISAAGLSGGGTIVGSLLTSGRTDLDCLAIASGAVSYKTRMKTSKKILSQRISYGSDTTGMSLKDVYDPLDDLSKVKDDPKRRVFMLSAENDEAVSYVSQKEFADRANALGIQVLQINAFGGGEEHHVTLKAGIRTLGRCVAGLRNTEIVAKVESSKLPVFPPAVAKTVTKVPAKAE